MLDLFNMFNNCGKKKKKTVVLEGFNKKRQNHITVMKSTLFLYYYIKPHEYDRQYDSVKT